MCVELEAELTAGRNLATALVDHVVRMSAANVEIPVTDAAGREWLVFAAGKSAVRPVPNSVTRSACEVWAAFRTRGGHPTRQELLAAQVLADEQIEDSEYQDLQDRAAATKALSLPPVDEQTRLAHSLADRLAAKPEVLVELADRLQNDEVEAWNEPTPEPAATSALHHWARVVDQHVLLVEFLARLPEWGIELDAARGGLSNVPCWSLNPVRLADRYLQVDRAALEQERRALLNRQRAINVPAQEPPCSTESSPS